MMRFLKRYNKDIATPYTFQCILFVLSFMELHHKIADTGHSAGSFSLIMWRTAVEEFCFPRRLTLGGSFSLF